MDYRKIYIENFGSIPKDDAGRNYDIHHIDGDHANNHPNNLTAISLLEHRDIHEERGDWQAVNLINYRLQFTGEEWAAMASERERIRVDEGTHHFIGPNINRKMIEKGKHPWIGGKQSSKNARKLVDEGKHPFSGGKIQSETNQRRIADGTHNWLGGGLVKKQLTEGTHNFQKRKTCPHCGHENNAGNMAIHMRKYHSDN